MSIDKRTWEKFKNDNDGASFIDFNTNSLCKDYDHEDSTGISEQLMKQENIEAWRLPGFNGCWSCKQILPCRYKIQT